MGVVASTADINLDDFALLRNTVMRVKGVPVLYLPIMYYPLHEDERSTGILMPTYGSSTFRGPSLSNAFFWAINRSQDATLFHDWFTKTGTGAGAEYRYLSGIGSAGQIRAYRLDQKATVFEQDGVTSSLPAQTSYVVNAAVNQALPYGLRAQGNVEYFSDVVTQQLYQQNDYQRSMSRRLISGGVTGSYGRTTVGGYYQRSEQFNDASSSTVYGSTPRLTANIAPSMLFGTPIYASLNTEYLFQPNRRLLDGVVISDESMGRIDIAPALRVPLSRLTFLSVTTNAAYRATHFSRSVDASSNLVDKPVTRQYLALQTDVIGPVVSKIWDTPDSGYSDRMKHVIEPTFSTEYITEVANQARVPITDSSIVAVGGAMKVTVGLNNRFIARTRGVGEARGSTREFLTVGVQQTYYTNPETSLFDTTYVSYSFRPAPVDLSPVAVTARVSPTPALDANARLEYDVTGNGLQTADRRQDAEHGGGFRQSELQPPAPDAGIRGKQLLLRRVIVAVQGRTVDRVLRIELGYRRQVHLQPKPRRRLPGAVLRRTGRLPGGQLSPLKQFTDPSDRRLNFAFVLAGLGTFSNFFGAFGGQR